MATDKTLRILHLEDNVTDAELIWATLAEQGIRATWTRVDNHQSFLGALETQHFDLILSDFSMPSFGGKEALEIAKQKYPEAPFIFVSGTIGEERAVEALLNGATDYVIKDRLFRLGAVVQRSMKDAALKAQKRLAEEHLHATYSQLQRLLAISPAVIYSTPFPPGEAATFVSENVQKRFGYEPGEFLGRSGFWLSHVHPDDRATVASRLKELPDVAPKPASYRLQHADGSYRWVEDHMDVIHNEKGVPIEIVGSWIDITDVKLLQDEMAKVQEQFHQAQKLEAIGSLVGGVCHDFNNILMVVLSYSDFVLRKLPEDSPVRREVEEIRKAGNRAADLTHQLLAFSRKETVSPQNLEMNGAIRNLSKMLGRLIGDGITLRLDLSKDPGFITCDPTQLDQILVNLVVNARDAMQTGGEIVIETRAVPEGEYRVSIKDSGTGISEENMAHIFEPFFTTKPAGKGTGLGLAMVYGAVKQNKGRITVESEVGKRTTFHIFFKSISNNTPARTQEVSDSGLELGGVTVLLVDDDPSVLVATTSLLEGLGAAVISASGGEEALKLFLANAESISVVLTDVTMPGISGPELAKSIRALNPNARILFSTGYVGEIERAEREGIAGSAIVQKPFDGLTIAAAIRSLG